MKLTKLFVMAVLVGSVAVIGCTTSSGGDPDPGTGGTGGTAGSGGAEACTGGFCVSVDIEADCEAAAAACRLDAELDLTEEECDALATELYCNLGTGGAGGMGGVGGTSGDISGCDESLCATDQARRDACEEFIPACIAYCEGQADACGEDECIGFALLFICNEQ